MNKTHTVILALVFLLAVSLAFAQQGQTTYVSGDVAAVNTPAGVVIEGDQVSYTVPMEGHAAGTHAKASQHRAAVNQQAAGAKATHAANAASLKKGEPTLKKTKTTTSTEVYDVSVKNKKGTTDYGVMEQTVTNARGQRTTDGVIYSTYQPSKAALVNERKMEISVAGGTTVSYNKDDRSDRYSTNGFAAGMSALHYMSDHLAVGVDYMMLHPGKKTHGSGAEERHYHGMYAHNIALAGELTLNPWDNWQVYMPMGAGMMNARLKTDTPAANTNENHWGASLYAGLGVQYNVTDWMFAGLEYRYTFGFIKDKHLTDFAKDRNLQFHVAMMRVGVRF